MPPKQNQQVAATTTFSSFLEQLKPKFKTPQFFWFLGHVSTVFNITLYTFFSIFGRRLSLRYYNFALLSIVTTYFIVLFQVFKASKTSFFSIKNLSTNDNFQYLSLAVVWYLVSNIKVIGGGLTPFIIFSVFHAANYFKNYILPILPSVPATTKDQASRIINTLITRYNEQSLVFATNCEIYILFSLLVGFPLTLYYLITNFWLAVVNVLVLAQYIHFMKVRYSHSKHTKLMIDGTIYQIEAKINSGILPPAISAYYNKIKQQAITIVNLL
ncbi:CYFA0S09e01574g1_1 [Cyberlindnera fabianii]|uniref:CYFA0S09e01574g1_1 n=1 Tax=Cyberlindnera fabianii TaxID=36022 RepID=A0A061AXE9_CYBFA|nr:Pore and endoplasmic reticulum protein of 33 kDa [Cyberlindnera fabianii]CDR42343.1 CYFA0S09e01574g1_1 [Cyberlindnera fabianii]